jgi:hypothetical protein
LLYRQNKSERIAQKKEDAGEQLTQNADFTRNLAKVMQRKPEMMCKMYKGRGKAGQGK